MFIRKTYLRKQAFTLIELLVVISIIALLLSILMPSLNKVKDSARAVVCKANLHQWSLCFSMYLEENNGKFMTGVTPGGNDATWMQMLRPYYQTPKIRTCPTATRTRWDEYGNNTGADGRFSAWGIWWNTGTWWTKGDYGSFGLNEWAYSQLPDGTTAWGGR